MSAVSDTPADLLHDAAMARVELAEEIAYTRKGGFHGPEGFAKLTTDTDPTWPLGSVRGGRTRIDGRRRIAVADGGRDGARESDGNHARWRACDIGDAALSTAYMSTFEDGQLFTTVDLRVNFLRPVRTGRIVAVGRVVHRGRTIGMVESEVTNEDDELVAKLSGTCLTLGDG